MNKVSCALIIRDEYSTLEACLESIKPHVDELVIVDTGSTDGSDQIARKYADRFEVFTDCNNDQGQIVDFALARNYATSLCSHDWYSWFDGDDIVTGAEHLRRLANAHPEAENVVCLMPYFYQFAPDGTCITQHWRERLVSKRSNFTWISPVHEVFNQQTGTPALTIPCHDVQVTHVRQQSKKPIDPSRNLRILEAHVARAGEGDVRALFYCGMELGKHGRLGESLTMLRRYVQLSGWSDERCLALLELGRHHLAIGDFETAIEWGLKALTVKSWSEPHWLIGRAFFALAQKGGPDQQYNTRRAGHWLQLGCSTRSESVLFLSPRERGEAHVLLNACLAGLGDLDGAIRSCEEGLRVIPNEENLVRNLQLFRTAKSKQTIVGELQNLTNMGSLDPQVARFILEGLQGRLQLQWPAQVVPARTPEPGKLDIVIFVGPGMEPWNPESIKKTGIGGSETMAWELSRRLAQLGHRVRFFGHCPGMEGQFEGVEFLNSTLERYKDLTCDVLISSRAPEAADPRLNITTKARILWVHDVHCGERLSRSLDLRYDRVLALSSWHRDTLMKVYPWMDPGKIIVTRNGIDPARFAEEQVRNPKRVVYSSSPDRGLHTLLNVWPKIRERVPDAELHVFYGFGNWERIATATNNSEHLGIIAQMRAACGQPGVTLRDRVPQDELAREFLSAGVWAYPTWFSETSCITAMEAQAAGLHIVTSPLAALNETVSKGLFIPGDVNSPEYQTAFVDAVVKAMTEPNEDDRMLVRNYALANFGLHDLANDWDRMLTNIVTEMIEDPLPKFRPLSYTIEPSPDGQPGHVCVVRAA